MKQRPRIYYSASQRALIWERWQKGETLHQIAGLFDRYHSSIQRIVAETGEDRPPLQTYEPGMASAGLRNPSNLLL
jgi:hypothetical protein